MNKKKVILLAVLLLIIGGGLTGYFLLNKPHPKAEDQQATVVAAQALYTAFTTNEQQANHTYLNKVLEITGTANEVSKNQDGKTVVVLSTDDPLGGIQCTFRDANTIAQGQTVTVKGFCNGYTMVVLLNDCVLVK